MSSMPTPGRRPFRTALRVADSATLARANEVRTKGSPAFRPFEDEVALMQAGADRIEIWICHPDERVVAHLIQDHYHVVAPSIRRGSMLEWTEGKKPLLERIYQDADREHLAWTPLIDIANHRDSIPNQTQVRERIKQLIRWSPSASEADLRELVSNMRSIGERWALAERVPITVALLQEWLAPDGPLANARRCICANKNLSPAMATYAAEQLSAEAERYCQGEIDRDAELRDVVVAFAHLFRGGHSVRSSQLGRLMSALRGLTGTTQRANRMNAAERLESFTGQLVHSLPGVTAEHLEAAYGLIPTANQRLDCATHGSADVRVWRMAVKDKPTPTLKRYLAKRAQARQDPLIRPILLESRDSHVRVDMVNEYNAEHFVRALRHLAAAARWEFVEQFMAKARPDQLADLNPGDLIPLLNAPLRTVRLAAQLALSKTSETSVESRPPSEARRNV